MALETLEVICAPYTIWLAPTGTSFPDVDASPTGGWAKLGHSGDKSYEEKGVTVTFEESLGTFRGAGSTGNRSVWRISEDITVAADLADFSAVTLAKLLNDATITQVAAGVGTAGTDSIPLLKGTTVAKYAALVRGVSPAGVEFAAQFQLPIVYQSAGFGSTFSKAAPAMVSAALKMLEDDDLGFGELVIQTADAS